MKIKQIRNQKGQVGIVAAILIVFGAMLFLLGQGKLSNITQEEQQGFFCRPVSITKDSPEIRAPSYTHVKHDPPIPSTDPFPIINPNDLRPYRLIKANTPFLLSQYWRDAVRMPNPGENQLRCPEPIPGPDGVAHYHFCQWIHPAVEPSPNPSPDKYAILYPTSFALAPGWSSQFYSETDNQGGHRIFFADYQLIFLVHIKNDNSLVTYDGVDKNGKNTRFILMDIYQQVRYDPSNPNPLPNPTGLPDEVLRCKDSPGSLGKFTMYQTMGAGDSDKSKLQLNGFIPKEATVEWSWYYPICKPAIYLYPEKETNVNVKVNTIGFLTYTDPLYPKEGWNVLAYPNGKIISNDKEYEYLYYESKILSSKVDKPRQGFVVEFNNLPRLYDDILPKLGLSQKQITDFSDYWRRALPYSPYYFVGVMPQDSIEKIESLAIVPSPDTKIRVRLYFEALDQKVNVQEPVLITPQKSGFTMIEWGGMVKTDKDSAFTCSQ